MKNIEHFLHKRGIMRDQTHFLKHDFSMLAILVIPIGVAVNFVGGQTAAILKLPLYLDAIGTMFVSMLCGPWVGAATGALSNLVSGVINPSVLPFIIVNIGVGLVTGFLANKNMFSSWWKWPISICIISAITIILSAPVVVLLYGGITGGGTSIITAVVMAAGVNIWTAFLGTEGIFTVLDRILSFIICLSVIRCIPPRILIKYKCGYTFIKDQKELPPM